VQGKSPSGTNRFTPGNVRCVQTLVELLARNGFVAADEEAQELRTAAGGDEVRLEAMVARRLTGEPLAWITGTAEFCGLTVRVDPGVYVPRWQTEPLARRALARLPQAGVAIDLCTGSGAVARVLMARAARVVASDLSDAAVACARANGVEAYRGDLFAPLPPLRADVITGVVPYVPTPDLPLLQRDTFAFEPELFYDGGADGMNVLRRVVAQAPRRLKPGGALLLEVGGRQAEALELGGFRDVALIHDEDGDVRGIEATCA
jgi:release factor glutamine methyltransferase